MRPNPETLKTVSAPHTGDEPRPDVREKPLVITQAVLDAARAANASKTVTSLSLATANNVESARYSRAEQSAAKLEHAMDYYGGYGGYGNSGARDALSFVQATAWPGFQTLSLLAQLPEYRSMHETLADEAVRTWGRITSTSKDQATPEKLTKLSHALDRLNVRSVVRTAIIHDQAFGGAHVFPRLKAAGSPVPPENPLLLSPSFVARGCLQEFANVEPQWVTPKQYNLIDPTKPDFYKPNEWLLVSQTVHATRLWTMVSRPVGDMLKAAYSFRGVSLSQLAMPYVDNWLRTRQSVSDTVKQFSITYLKVDMSQMLVPGGAADLMNRAELFNLARDNRNLGLIDMTQEDFGQINTPLSGLDALQAQSQEQMAAVAHIPLVKLLGITPAGLNANSDGEIRVWYDYVAGYQAHNVTPLMKWILELVQLSEFGEIDPGLAWEWNPLYELTALEEAEMRDKHSTTDERYVSLGVLSPEMVAQRLEADPTSGYAGIMADRDELDEVNDIAEEILRESFEPTPPEQNAEQAQDAQWTEGDHPRADNGQFGASASASASASGAPNKRKAAAAKIKEGQKRVSKPFAVEKDDWGDYTADGISGSLPKQHITVKNGHVVGMNPSLAKNTNVEVEGEVEAKSDKTVAKEAAAAALKAKEAADRAAHAKSVVFQMTVGKRLAKLEGGKQSEAQSKLREALTDMTIGTAQRVDNAEAILKSFGV